MLQWTAENAGTLTTEYGNVSKQSVGTIQRPLLTLSQQGGERFFGEPALDLNDMIAPRSLRASATINILAADKLMQSPRLYATFLLWLLSELFEVAARGRAISTSRSSSSSSTRRICCSTMRPRRCCRRIEQVVRLIRSKGVGVYFITQNPLDVPETVLGQLGNRVQHALRAFTPRDQKAVKVAAETFRPNKAFNAAEVITELGVGEALLSLPRRQGRALAGRALLHRAAAAAASVRRPTRSARRSMTASPLAGKVRARSSIASRPTRC